MPPTTISDPYQLALEYVLHTNRTIFLTGRAGTGKTTFLKQICSTTNKNTLVTAPTGVAAIHAGGVTLHSLFQLPPVSFIPGRPNHFDSIPERGMDLTSLLKNLRFNKEKKKLLQKVELLIIDEASMLRADMLDAIDGILRFIRKRGDEPFGGVQLLLIGDLFQLPPVVNAREEEWMSAYYPSLFFFDALIFRNHVPVVITLEKIYRQTDTCFIELLNKIRNNTVTSGDLTQLNEHYRPGFRPSPDEGYITLSSHNYKADQINRSALKRLNGGTYVFNARLTGEFNESVIPVEKTLELKENAQVMFVRNDKGDNGRYYNGKIGIVSQITQEEIHVRFSNGQEIKVEPETWRNIRYRYNESEDRIQEDEIGSFKQYPIRLAWAVTIHKSQGLTFEKAIIDAGRSFAAGQVYVALSRLTSLNGLILASPILPTAIHLDERVLAFARHHSDPQQAVVELAPAKKEYLLATLWKSFDWCDIWQHFEENHSSYATRNIPKLPEAIAWSAQMIECLSRLRGLSNRFRQELQTLLDGKQNAIFQKRVQVAGDYFEKEMKLQVLAPLQAHISLMSGQKRVTKYLRVLKNLEQEVLKKQTDLKKAIDQVFTLSKDPHHTIIS